MTESRSVRTTWFIQSVAIAFTLTAISCGKTETTPDKSAPSASAAATTVPASTAATTQSPLASLGSADSALVARADKGRLMGRDSGALWVVMISDFQCPYCKQWHNESLEKLTRDYITPGKVRFAYMHLPLPNHPFARAQAEASMCASAQNKFWPYAEALFARQKEISALPSVQPAILSIAKSLKLDMAEFAACQKSDAVRSLVESDIQQATNARIQSTPSFLVGDFMVEGALPYADFRRAVDTALVTARAKRPR